MPKIYLRVPVQPAENCEVAITTLGKGYARHPYSDRIGAGGYERGGRKAEDEETAASKFELFRNSLAPKRRMDAGAAQTLHRSGERYVSRARLFGFGQRNGPICESPLPRLPDERRPNIRVSVLA